MLGAIIGDIVGSRYEFNNIKTKKFKLFDSNCFFTDDTVMTFAVYLALESGKKPLENQVIYYMQKLGREYPNRGYGGTFYWWIYNQDPTPYWSFGNGAAMRISPVVDFAHSLKELKELTYKITCVTHDHPEGLKGAEATAIAIWMAKRGKSIAEIRKYINDNYYKLDFTLDKIRSTYKFNETCQDTVPQAIEAFLESTSFEDAIRNAISIGGDSDTLAAITGSIAEAYYGIPKKIIRKAMSYLDDNFKIISRRYYKKMQTSFYQRI